MAPRLKQLLRIAGLALGLAIAAAPAVASICDTCCCDATPCHESAEPCASLEATPCCEGAPPASLPNVTHVQTGSAPAVGVGLPALPPRQETCFPAVSKDLEAQASPLRLSVVLRI